MSLSLKISKDKQRWNDFVNLSPQGNIFCTTPFLDALDVDYNLLLVEKNRTSLLGAVVLRKNSQPIRTPYPFTMYQGILFSNSFYDAPNHQRIKKALELTDYLLTEMEKHYRIISFSLHYKIEDLRSFSWFHYHRSQAAHFKIILRYTGLINLKKYRSFNDYLNQVRKVRRYEYHQAVKNKLKVEKSDNIDMLDYLHQLTFERQGIRRTLAEKRNLRNISRVSLKREFGELLLCRNNRDIVIGATLFLYDKKCGYYLVGANHPSYRATGSGTLLMLENIRRCFQKGIDFVDVCGINSPHRGDFKTSFNALPKPYFEVVWEKPSKRL